MSADLRESATNQNGEYVLLGYEWIARSYETAAAGVTTAPPSRY